MGNNDVSFTLIECCKNGGRVKLPKLNWLARISQKIKKTVNHGETTGVSFVHL